MKTYSIEIRVDFDDDEKYQIIENSARDLARQLYAMATLIKDRRNPQIAFQSGDMFVKNSELDIMQEQED